MSNFEEQNKNALYFQSDTYMLKSLPWSANEELRLASLPLELSTCTKDSFGILCCYQIKQWRSVYWIHWSTCNTSCPSCVFYISIKMCRHLKFFRGSQHYNVAEPALIWIMDDLLSFYCTMKLLSTSVHLYITYM